MAEPKRCKALQGAARRCKTLQDAHTDVDVALHELGRGALARDDRHARVGDARLLGVAALGGGGHEEELFVL